MLPITTEQPIHIEIDKALATRHGPGIPQNEQDPSPAVQFFAKQVINDC